jgi:hypothetical protein
MKDLADSALIARLAQAFPDDAIDTPKGTVFLDTISEISYRLNARRAAVKTHESRVEEGVRSVLAAGFDAGVEAMREKFSCCSYDCMGSCREETPINPFRSVEKSNG